MYETLLRCNKETREISQQQIAFITKTIWKKLPSRLECFRLERVSLSEQDNTFSLGLSRLIIWPPIHVARSKAWRWGPKQGTPSNGLYGETLPEGGTFVKSLVDQKYMKMWGNMSFWCVKESKGANKLIFLKLQVKRDAVSFTWNVKGVQLVNRRHTEGVPYRSKMLVKG